MKNKLEEIELRIKNKYEGHRLETELTDLSTLLQIIEIQAEALEYIGYSPTRDCKEPIARQAIQQVETLVSGGKSE